MLLDIGLEVNPSKSEVSNVTCDNFQSAVIEIKTVLPRVSVTEREALCFLGAQINISGCHIRVLKAVDRLFLLLLLARLNNRQDVVFRGFGRRSP